MITRFLVENFKSIDKVDVELSPVTVLVGRSGSGKSNFFSAMKFLRDVLRGGNRATGDEWNRSRPANNPKALPRFEVEFVIDGIPDQFTYTLELHSMADPKEEKLTKGEDVVFHTKRATKSVAAQWVSKPATSNLPRNANALVLGSLPSVSDAVVAFTAIVAGVGCYSFSDAVLTGGPAKDSAFVGLSDNASNYHFVLKDIVSNLQNLTLKNTMVETLRKVNSSVASVELNDIRNPGQVIVAHAFGDSTLALTLGLESDGFRRFYAHLLALYQRPPQADHALRTP